ncbi:MAG: uracil-DNA glycosylase 2 [Candidatus Dojkabacteria bacterium]|nr:MAG: uracil-DNA glycosylase 2 [Candidatus Dojkabacteria bacterium]
MNVKINDSWKNLLQEEFEKQYFKDLASFVREEYSKFRVYPPGSSIFNAFELCPFDKVKVVILGQDPYHGPNQAHGLAFSVTDGVKIPPSLQNIFKEINQEFGTPIPKSGNLERWAKQGVFLLNSILTVRAGQPGSHKGKGWEIFTDKVIEILSENKNNLVFLLWGNFAQNKASLIDSNRHLILKSPHPSPYSANRGFFGNKHFIKTNNYLIENNLEPIVW